MSRTPQVSIHLIVRNGEPYLRECLAHVAAQTYPNIVLRVFDNASTDTTRQLTKELAPEAELISFDRNYVVGGGFNRSVAYSDSPYLMMLCVDVLLAPDFIERAVSAMEDDERRGVLQAKVFYYEGASARKTNIIDTTGMQVFRSRRVINRGHGQRDEGQFEQGEEIFLYEGAAPFFRRIALDEAKMGEEYLDEDFVWYADDVDFAWRLRLLGWKCWYEPRVRAWHDRSTTHTLSKGWRSFVQQRKTIPPQKRMLDLRNQRLTFLKNDFFVTLCLHSPWILKREVLLLAYVILFERSSLRAYLDVVRMAPRMLSKRRSILERATQSERQMRAWFLS